MYKKSKSNIFKSRIGKNISLKEIKDLKLMSGVYVFTFRGTVWAVDKNTFLKNVK